MTNGNNFKCLRYLGSFFKLELIGAIMEVVVAQVVEQCHSVLAGRVRIPGWTLAFSVQNSCQSILTGCPAFSNNV